jgi:thiamine biosynthesis lipoprotein
MVPSERALTDRLRHAEHVMGTVFSFDVPAHLGPAQSAGPLADAVHWLHWVDATFSPYREDSGVSRFGRGELTLAQCAPELAEILDQCAAISELSGGYFTTTPGGRLDPSGFVKGWAVERAAAMLSDAGSASHSVNGGGDVQCAGEPRPGQPWRIGIAHPLRPAALALVVAGRDFAVATSGTAERGKHIIDPHTGMPAAALASITLVGRYLTTTDAYATAAFAMGGKARDWVETLDGHEAFAITADGGMWQTSGFSAYLALPFDLIETPGSASGRDKGGQQRIELGDLRIAEQAGEVTLRAVLGFQCLGEIPVAGRGQLQHVLAPVCGVPVAEDQPGCVEVVDGLHDRGTGYAHAGGQPLLGAGLCGVQRRQHRGASRLNAVCAHRLHTLTAEPPVCVLEQKAGLAGERFGEVGDQVGDDRSQQVVEALLACRLQWCRQLHLGGARRIAHLLKGVPAITGNTQGVATTVGRVTLPSHQVGGFEAVDHRDHDRAIHL